MARRYTRDNRGRFASVGATARGGRLATASGKKRETQTAKIKGGAASGTIGKPRGLKRGAIKPKPAATKPMTRDEYEAAARKAWGSGWNAKGSAKPAQKADQQLDRLATRSRNRQNSREGLSKSEAMKASELAKETGRKVRVTQNENGSFAVQVAPKPAARRGVVGKIDDAKAGRIIGRIDANRPGLRRASGSARKTANAIKTQRKAVDFALAAGARARKQGKSLSVNDSLRRAVANAAKKRRRSG